MTEHQIGSIKLESGLNGVIVYVNHKCKDDEQQHPARFDVRHFTEFLELIRKSLGLTLEQFLCFQFVSGIDRFDEALNDKIYNVEHITANNIEDRILVPALEKLLVPDTEMFPYDAHNGYWDKCISSGLLTKMTDRNFTNYYDSEKWCHHMNTKLKNVTLSHVNEYISEITVRPKCGSFWYIKINYNDHSGNKDTYALCGFGHSFIFYND